MNWDKLRKRHPHLRDTSDGYHQHANGGGWIADDVSVRSDITVGECALILGGIIRGGTIRGGSIHGGTIRGGTILGGSILGGTIIGGTILTGTIVRTPLLIFGTQYWIGYAGGDLVSSGCIANPLAWWLDNVERCAEKNGYDDRERAEYRMHVESLAAWMRLYGYVDSKAEPKTNATNSS